MIYLDIVYVLVSCVFCEISENDKERGGPKRSKMEEKYPKGFSFIFYFLFSPIKSGFAVHRSVEVKRIIGRTGNIYTILLMK